MEIFYFAVAIFLLAYLPGLLLLNFVKLNSSRLEQMTMALIVGLIVSSGLYWLAVFGHFQRNFFLWPLFVAILLFWRVWVGNHVKQQSWTGWVWSQCVVLSRWRPGLQHAMLGVVIATGLALQAVLPLYHSNLTLTSDGGLRIADAPDALFHIGIVRELTHAAPPEAPVISGVRLSYHYGPDVPAAMFSGFMGLSPPDLVVRLMPALYFVQTVLAVFCFSRIWLRSGLWAALACLLVFFGEEFSYIPGWLLGVPVDWSVIFFSVPCVYSLFYVNPMLPGLGLLCAALFCLEKHSLERKTGWLLLGALLLAGLTECKIFTAAHLGLCLGLGAIWHSWVFRSFSFAKTVALPLLAMVPSVLATWLHNQSGAGYGVTLNAVTLPQAMKQMGFSDELASLPWVLVTGLPLYLLGSFGMRAVGLPALWKALMRPSFEKPMRIVVALLVVTGPVLTLAFAILPKGMPSGYNNSIWFCVHSKYIAWLFALDVLRQLSVSRCWKLFAAVGMVLLSVPSTIQHFGLHLQIVTDIVPSQTVAAVTFVGGKARPGAVVLAETDMVPPLLAMATVRMFYGPFAEYMAPLAILQQRQDELRNFWRSWKRGKLRLDIIRGHRVNFILAHKVQGQVLPILSGGWELVFENESCAVFERTRR